MLPIQFLSGLVLGLKRWPAVLAVVVGWLLFSVFWSALDGEPPAVRLVLDLLLVSLANAIAGVALHELAALFRRGIYGLFRRRFTRS